MSRLLFTRLNTLKFTRLKSWKVHVPFLPLLYLSQRQLLNGVTLRSCSLKLVIALAFHSFLSFNLLQRIDLPHMRTSVHIGHNYKVLSQGNWNGAEGRLGCLVVSLHHEAKPPWVKWLCSKTTVSGGVTDPRVTANQVIPANYPFFCGVLQLYESLWRLENSIST